MSRISWQATAWKGRTQHRDQTFTIDIREDEDDGELKWHVGSRYIGLQNDVVTPGQVEAMRDASAWLNSFLSTWDAVEEEMTREEKIAFCEERWSLYTHYEIHPNRDWWVEKGLLEWRSFQVVCPHLYLTPLGAFLASHWQDMVQPSQEANIP